LRAQLSFDWLTSAVNVQILAAMWVKKKKGEGNYANNSNLYVSNYNKVDK